MIACNFDIAIKRATDQANASFEAFGNTLNALGWQMNEDIITEAFPELQKHHDGQSGTYEYSNPQAARVHFAQVMQAHGYRPGGNHMWQKSGFAAVMEPN